MAYVRLFCCICVVVVLFSLSVHVFAGVMKNGTPNLKDFHWIPRASWSIVPPTEGIPAKLPVPYVVVHHTFIPKACFSVEQCIRAMGSMQNYHNSLRWGDIGYNFCIGADGTAFEGRGWDIRGIHAGLANNHSVGICMIGDWRVALYDTAWEEMGWLKFYSAGNHTALGAYIEELPPQKSMASLKALIRKGVQLGKIKEDYKLIGHQQAMNTECPGAALMAEISTWEHYEPGSPDFKHMYTPNNS